MSADNPNLPTPATELELDAAEEREVMNAVMDALKISTGAASVREVNIALYNMRNDPDYSLTHSQFKTMAVGLKYLSEKLQGRELVLGTIMFYWRLARDHSRALEEENSRLKSRVEDLKRQLEKLNN